MITSGYTRSQHAVLVVTQPNASARSQWHNFYMHLWQHHAHMHSPCSPYPRARTLCIWPTEQLQKLVPPSAGLLVSHYVQEPRLETVKAKHCRVQGNSRSHTICFHSCRESLDAPAAAPDVQYDVQSNDRNLITQVSQICHAQMPSLCCKQHCS